MAISAKRFQCLSGETDPIYGDLLTGGDANYNSVTNELMDISGDMSKFIESADTNIPDPQSLLDEAKENLNEITPDIDLGAPLREAKGLMGGLRDMSGLAPKALEQSVAGMLPNNQLAQSSFNKLARQCKNNAGGYGGLGKPYSPSMNCNGRNKKAGSGGCSSSSFGDILSKLTNGDFSGVFRDLNALLGSLFGLSKYGYNLNMCGVFGSLTNSLDGAGEVASRASAGLLSALSLDQNINGITDLAGTVVRDGLTPWLEVPGSANMVMAGVSMPDDLMERDYSQMAERIMGSAEAVDNDWTTSDYMGSDVLTMIDNPGAKDIFESNVMGNIADADDLDAINAISSPSETFVAFNNGDIGRQISSFW